ncbi:hypothetical protein BJX96DRAFT_142916 [Aspergillus floccosus]
MIAARQNHFVFDSSFQPTTRIEAPKIIKATSSGRKKSTVSTCFLVSPFRFTIISHRHDCHHHYHYHYQYTIIAGSQASGFSVFCSCFCVVSFARVLRCLHIMSTRPRLGRPCF